DLGDELVLARRTVDRTVAGDGADSPTVTDLVHLITRRSIQRVDELRVHVGEDNLVAGVVKQQTDESSSDVACAEVNCFHSALTSSSSENSSFASAAFTSFETSSSSENTMAIFERIS